MLNPQQMVMIPTNGHDPTNGGSIPKVGDELFKSLILCTKNDFGYQFNKVISP